MARGVVLNRTEATSDDQDRPAGDADFEEVVRQHWSAVYGLLHRLTRNRHDTEDLTQETFLRALDRLSSFKPGTNLRAWLMRIATNAFLDLRRKRQAADVRVLEHEPPHPDPGPDQAAASAELAELIDAAIGELPQKARVVFLLRTQQELSFREIAEMIQTSEETARWHMHQARSLLMRRLNGKL